MGGVGSGGVEGAGQGRFSAVGMRSLVAAQDAWVPHVVPHAGPRVHFGEIKRVASLTAALPGVRVAGGAA